MSQQARQTQQHDIPRKPDGSINWDAWLFQDPEAALAGRDAILSQRLEQRYLAAESQKQFWETFYHRYPHLRTERAEIVTRDLLARNEGDVMGMQVKEAAAKLAELTEGALQRQDRNQAREREASVIVGGPGLEGKPMRPPLIEDGDDYSLGQIIKARREARQAD